MMRGDAELASVMRRMLKEEDEVVFDLSWSPHDQCYIVSISGAISVSEEEAQAIQEAGSS